MSTHAIEIVEIGEILPHPDPLVEKMQLTHVWGWQCCIGKGEFVTGDKAVYIEPDYVVPLDHPSFSFLKNQERYKGKEEARITIARFKKAVSQGMLIPLPEECRGMPVGASVMDMLRIHRYEPPIPMNKEFVPGPSTAITPEAFDVETFQRHAGVIFKSDEEVIATEKLNGTSGRYTYAKDKSGEYKAFCGTRVHWMEDSGTNPYSQAYRQIPDIGRWVKDHPDLILYGEVFGGGRKFGYGAVGDQKFFAAFAILDGQRWIDYDDCQQLMAGYAVPWAPLVYRGKYDPELLAQKAEEDSHWPSSPPGHMMEGVVVIPVKERRDANLQACGSRVCLKLVSNRYYSKG